MQEKSLVAAVSRQTHSFSAWRVSGAENHSLVTIIRLGQNLKSVFILTPYSGQAPQKSIDILPKQGPRKKEVGTLGFDPLTIPSA